MKDELGGKITTEFFALRVKMYAYWKIDKGVEFQDYKTCLFDGETIYREQMLFENKKHEVYTVNKPKIAMSIDDDKRLVQADRITTLAWGYAPLSA